MYIYAVWSWACHLLVLPWQARRQDQVPPLQHFPLAASPVSLAFRPWLPPPPPPPGPPAKTAYHDGEGHADECPHAPCFCPEPGRGLAARPPHLRAHFTPTHGWPLTVIRRNNRAVDLQLQEGRRVLHFLDVEGDGGHLFLLNVAPAGPAGVAVGTVLLVEPRVGATSTPAPPMFECHVAFYCRATGSRQSSEFAVRSTSLSDGLPVDSYAFVVPKVGQPPATASVVVSAFDVSRRRARSGDLRLRSN
uniref:SIAH-type domain-containing protein n=1 Tax=Oryza brachyantha TaxID=4533 RepID=J3KVZ5_ORYBR